MSEKAHFAAGLNDFNYCASLCIHHPSIHPNLITSELGFTPNAAHYAGEARATAKGSPLSGQWESSYWSAELDVVDGEDISIFLLRLIEQLTPAMSFLSGISNEGANIECFIGLFATRLCDQRIPARQLLTLGRLNIDIRLDYYGPDSPSK